MAGADGLVPGPPRLQIAGAIATLTLCRPALANRLELEDLATLQRQLAEVDARPGVRVLRLLGQGRHFCSGFNIDRLGSDGQTPGALFEATADALEQARPVTIAVLQGGAFGGAVDLALACDFRIGAPAASVVVPAARLGLHFYRSGLERFVDRLGLAVAKRLLLAGETLDAEALHAAGFIDRLVQTGDELMPEVERFSQGLAGMAPLALLGMKKHLNRIARQRLDAAELAHDIALADASEDLREGQAAWQARRPPAFEGR